MQEMQEIASIMIFQYPQNNMRNKLGISRLFPLFCILNPYINKLWKGDGYHTLRPSNIT